MSSRYDSRTTTFSPEGRLYQVEYAVEAISKAGTALGILTSEGVILATEKRMQHALLDSENVQDRNVSGEKVFKISDHLGCAVAGITSDANTLLNYVRVAAQRHQYTYQEPMPAEDLCRALCDVKQGYTQYGGVRPFGVSFLMGGWDKYFGFQLYTTDPSGNYNGWKAYAVGENDATAQGLLKQDWKEKMTLHEGLLLALKVLGKTMDTNSLSTDRVEVAVLSKGPNPSRTSLLNPGVVGPEKIPQFSILTAAQVKPFVEEAEKLRKKEEEEELKKSNERDKM